MRALILFHQWDIAEDAIDPIAIISEIVWEHSDDSYEEEIWQAAKDKYGVADRPTNSFRTAWVNLSGAHDLFAEVDLGTVEVEPA